MKVRYLGFKAKNPIFLPVGAKTRSTIKKIVWADPYAELSDADAVSLVARFPEKYILVGEPEPEGFSAPKEPKAGLEIHEDPKPLKKSGRPKKDPLGK